MELSNRKEGSALVVSVKGRMDAVTSPVFEKSVESLMGDGESVFVIDLANLDYISSAGLGVLMQFIEDVRRNDGDIKLSNMSTRVYNVFDLLGFPMLYEIFSDETEAVERFQNKSENPS